MLEPARIVALLLLAAALLAAACAADDPKERIRDERARWDVRVFSWTQEAGGAINVGTQVSGPPNSRLEQLTVRVDLMDAQERSVLQHWHTYDLTQVPRGGPSDLVIRVPDPGLQVEGLTLSLLLQPTPEEQARIPEFHP